MSHRLCMRSHTVTNSVFVTAISSSRTSCSSTVEATRRSNSSTSAMASDSAVNFPCAKSLARLTPRLQRCSRSATTSAVTYGAWVWWPTFFYRVGGPSNQSISQTNRAPRSRLSSQVFSWADTISWSDIPHYLFSIARILLYHLYFICTA